MEQVKKNDFDKRTEFNTTINSPKINNKTKSGEESKLIEFI